MSKTLLRHTHLIFFESTCFNVQTAFDSHTKKTVLLRLSYYELKTRILESITYLIYVERVVQLCGLRLVTAISTKIKFEHILFFNKTTCSVHVAKILCRN